MLTNDERKATQLALRDRGLCSYVNKGRQIVVSRQRGPVWPNRGNSFWIGCFGGEWHVVTWTPVAYRVPAAVSVVDVAAAFMDVGNEAQWRIPPEMIAQFGLEEIGFGEFERLWSAR